MVNHSEKSQRFKVTLYFWKKKRKFIYTPIFICFMRQKLRVRLRIESGPSFILQNFGECHLLKPTLYLCTVLYGELWKFNKQPHD